MEKELPRVFVTRRVADSALARLREFAQIDLWPAEMPPAYAELTAHCGNADGLLCMVTDSVDRALMDAAPRLRVISQLGVGVNNIDLEAARARGIPVGHTPGILTETTAEFAFALLLAVARRVVEAERYVRDGRWRTWGPEILLGRDLHGATLGIIGYGAIGQAVAQRARGFSMRILYHSRAPRPQGTDAECVPLQELLQRSDFISLHAPLTPQTRGLLGAREFALMKPGAILVNTARGEEVDEVALLEALRSGHLGGAGLDVTAVEPLPRDHPLLGLANVVITPHIGSGSLTTRRRMAEMAVENLRAGLAGEIPARCANLPVTPGRR
jgi:glyoxylate reductase